METINAWTDVPDFESHADEADFWANHCLSPKLLSGSRHETDGKESTTITLRFDPRMLSSIKRMVEKPKLEDAPVGPGSLPGARAP